MSPSEVLRASAQRVRKGWCRGNLFDIHGGVCAIGAICEVSGEENIALVADAEEALRDVLGNHGIVDWNDRATQTAENVALTMELAADFWDANQGRERTPLELALDAVFA